MGGDDVVKAVSANTSAFPNAFNAGIVIVVCQDIGKRKSLREFAMVHVVHRESPISERAISRAEYKQLEIGKKNDRFGLLGDYKSVVVKR